MRALLVLPVVALAACGGPRQITVSQTDFNACLIETRAPGAYTLSQTEFGNSGAPAVFPAEGGNAEGAGLMQACLARKASDGTATTATGGSGGGSLPLPTQYVLQPGDAELWPTLTQAQQERALSFLADGSTISASLGSDV